MNADAFVCQSCQIAASSAVTAAAFNTRRTILVEKVLR
jgi:hypothetical protein